MTPALWWTQPLRCWPALWESGVPCDGRTCGALLCSEEGGRNAIAAPTSVYAPLCADVACCAQHSLSTLRADTASRLLCIFACCRRGSVALQRDRRFVVFNDVARNPVSVTYNSLLAARDDWSLEGVHDLVTYRI